MRSIATSLIAACVLVSLGVAAANDPKQLQDLTAVIALNGKACGEVVSYTVRGENDFTAVCKDGNRYRVHVKDGRVVVDKI